MLVIDAQVHIWGSGKPSGHHRQTSVFTAEELIEEMDAAGVNGAVLHPPSWDAGSNEMAIEAAKKYPNKFCSLGWFPARGAKVWARLIFRLRRLGAVDSLRGCVAATLSFRSEPSRA